ncbi:MAG: hypothetical protein LBD89_00110 [Tannerellaceae bacterium]|jgi:hypothetical protein|nr:hypothetical protein [Tannerellaceae bacterium]
MMQIKRGGLISIITTGESDDSALLYIDSHVIANYTHTILDKSRNPIRRHPDDNPCILEFF